MVLVVPEIVIYGNLLYEKLSLSSVSVPVSIWFLVTHTATYHRPVATEHVLNTVKPALNGPCIKRNLS